MAAAGFSVGVSTKTGGGAFGGKRKAAGGAFGGSSTGLLGTVAGEWLAGGAEGTGRGALWMCTVTCAGPLARGVREGRGAGRGKVLVALTKDVPPSDVAETQELADEELDPEEAALLARLLRLPFFSFLSFLSFFTFPPMTSPCSFSM